MKESAITRIDKIINLWFLEKPLYFSVYCTHQIIENNNIKVPLRTGLKRIEYSSVIINTLNDKLLEELLEIEIIRILLKHPYQRQPLFAKKDILTLASNYTINDFCYFVYPIYGINLFKLPSELCFEEYYSLIENHINDSDGERTDNVNNSQNEQNNTNDNSNNSSEESSDKSIDNNNKSQEKSNSETENTNNNSNEQNNILNENNEYNADSSNTDKDKLINNNQDELNHKKDTKNESSEDGKNDANSFSEKKIDNNTDLVQFNNELYDIQEKGKNAAELWEENESVQEEIDALIDFADNSDTWGNISQEIKEKIQASMIIKIDYRKMLSFYRTSILSSKRYLTRMKPNRRYGFDAMGSKYALRSNLLVAVDVSGSVTTNSLEKFYSIINRFFKYGIESIDILQFDCDITQNVMPLKKARKNIEISGRGCTNFQPAVDYCKYTKKYDGLIYFTDGQGIFPDNTGLNIEILWIINSFKNYNTFIKRNGNIRKNRVTYIPLPENL